jgi:hypothetical protein
MKLTLFKVFLILLGLILIPNVYSWQSCAIPVNAGGNWLTVIMIVGVGYIRGGHIKLEWPLRGEHLLAV